jgi:hypothetical protein
MTAHRLVTEAAAEASTTNCGAMGGDTAERGVLVINDLAIDHSLFRLASALRSVTTPFLMSA